MRRSGPRVAAWSGTCWPKVLCSPLAPPLWVSSWPGWASDSCETSGPPTFLARTKSHSAGPCCGCCRVSRQPARCCSDLCRPCTGAAARWTSPCAPWGARLQAAWLSDACDKPSSGVSSQSRRRFWSSQGCFLSAWTIGARQSGLRHPQPAQRVDIAAGRLVCRAGPRRHVLGRVPATRRGAPGRFGGRVCRWPPAQRCGQLQQLRSGGLADASRTIATCHAVGVRDAGVPRSSRPLASGRTPLRPARRPRPQRRSRRRRSGLVKAVLSE